MNVLFVAKNFADYHDNMMLEQVLQAYMKSHSNGNVFKDYVYIGTSNAMTSLAVWQDGVIRDSSKIIMSNCQVGLISALLEQFKYFEWYSIDEIWIMHNVSAATKYDIAMLAKGRARCFEIYNITESHERMTWDIYRIPIYTYEQSEAAVSSPTMTHIDILF